MMKILITGSQGSGKTTQAQILAKKLGLCLVDAGELLRDFSQSKTQEGEAVKEEMVEGKMVNDKTTVELVLDKLSSSECSKGYVMDGYPRNFGSLELFDPDFDQVFYLQISDEEAIKRLLKRGREDDTPLAIEERLKIYHQQTEPVLDYYQKKGKLVSLSGERPAEEIAQEIESFVKKEKN